MEKANISRATLGRLPMYLAYLKKCEDEEYTSSATVAAALELGEVLVRKDLASVCDKGRPKLGYRTDELIRAIESALGTDKKSYAVVVGAGQLGRAILGYNGFSDYGIEIPCAFDIREEIIGKKLNNKEIFSVDTLETFCSENQIKTGILTVPSATAQKACDMMIKAGITAIWNFVPVTLCVPENVLVKNENLALSLAHLKMNIDNRSTERKAELF